MEDVEGDNRESRFGLYRSETSREEPSAAGHPFNRAEGVLYSTSAGHHQARIRVDSGLHTIQRRLVEQPMDGPLGAGRASALQPTVFACRRSISDRTVAGMFAGWSQRLAGGAPDCVGLLIIHELRWPEKIGAQGSRRSPFRCAQRHGQAGRRQRCSLSSRPRASSSRPARPIDR